MQYTDLTRKELQREYSRLTRKYTDFIRQPVELDLTTEEPLPGLREPPVREAFGAMLDRGCAIPAQPHLKHRTLLSVQPRCGGATARWAVPQSGCRFDAIDHCTVLARTIGGYPVRRADPRCQRLCCPAPMAPLESLQGN